MCCCPCCLLRTSSKPILQWIQVAFNQNYPMIWCCWQLRVITYLFNGIFSIPLWHGLLRIFRLWENAVFPYLVRTRVHVLIIAEALSSIFWKLLTICVCFLNSYVVVNLRHCYKRHETRLSLKVFEKQDLVWKYWKCLKVLFRRLRGRNKLIFVFILTTWSWNADEDRAWARFCPSHDYFTKWFSCFPLPLGGAEMRLLCLMFELMKRYSTN